jgi:Replication-relaxation
MMESLSISLQPRDLALLRGLFECRVMNPGHIATLYFDGREPATKKRLRKLKASGLINERPRRAYEPSVLFLTRKGLVLLQERGILAEYPALNMPVLDKRARVSELTLRHELEIMDVKAAFHSAIKKTQHFSVKEFTTWPLLYQFEAVRSGYGSAEVTVKPDGFIRIHEKEKDDGLFERTFFLELDRSSETQDTLVSRAGCYRDFYSSGGFAARNGAPRSAYKKYPFRVLMIFKNSERRNNTAERLLQINPPILRLVYLSTFEEVTADPLGAVWLRPIDYREATKGTPFDTEHQRKEWGYKRQTAREVFVEKKVRKLRILADEAEG